MTAESHRSAAALPIHLTRFIGRGRELDTLAGLLGRERLVTLTGAGGSGKTRLACELASRAAEHFDRVVWVDLAPIADGALVTRQLSIALDLAERADVATVDIVNDAIGDARTLIVFDNCEHVVDASAKVVESLLRSCPRLTVLATSREALGASTEAAWLVPPLSTDEARELFVERARTATPGFAANDAGAGAIAEICRRLDGIPLAIELAAARVRVLSPEQIASRLDDAFRLLTSGGRTAIPRHRTLRATMEWSLALLGASEQVLLRRLSVFAGGFGLDAAEAVCAGGKLDANDLLDGIAALVDKSWVVMDSGDGTARYHLLETVRQYAREQLVAAGEAEAYERAHAAYFLSVIEETAPYLVGGPSKPGLLERLRRDQDNIRGAAVWMLSGDLRAEMGLRLAGALFWLWYAFGSLRDLRELVDRALALPATGDPLLRARAVLTSALTALAQGDYPLAIRHFDETEPVLQAGGDEMSFGAAVSMHGAAHLLGGDLARAIPVLDHGVALTADLPAHDIRAIFACFWRSWAAYLQGEYDLARSMMMRNLGAAEGAALPTAIAHSKAVLARVEIQRGDMDAACRLAAEGLEGEAAIGDGWGIALAADAVAIIAARRGRPEDAVRIIAAVEAHRQRLAMAIPGVAPGEREALLSELRTKLGAQFDAAWSSGRAMSTEALTALALAEAARHTSEHRVFVLREAPPPDDARLRVAALGALQVSIGGRAIDARAWGSVRTRELLVYLLLHPDGRTKEQVGLAFWPDSSASQLRNAFHVTLHRLRRALGGAEWVVIVGERYRINATMLEEFDVIAFERDLDEALVAVRRRADGAVLRLEQTLARYRGDFLDGEPFGDWHLEYRERLQQRYVDGLMTLGAAWSAEARHARAVEVYRRVLTRDELHEEALRALLRALTESGERAQGLRTYERFRDKLKAELGVAPGPDTERVVAEIRRNTL